MASKRPMTTPDPLAADLNRQGMSALRNGDPAAAALFFEQAASRDVTASALWRNAASAYRASGDATGEKRALNAALDVDRRDFLAWLRLAELHQREGSDADALAAWNAALMLADQADSLPPVLDAPLAAGRAFVASANERIGQSVAAALADVRAGLTTSEARRVDAMIGRASGERKIYTNQCAGLHYPFLPADEFFDRAGFPWLADLEAQTDAIRGELQALLADPGSALRPYVRMDKGTSDTPWSTLDGSLDWGACFLWEFGMPNPPVLDRCPFTAAAVSAIPGLSIPGRAPSAFFSLLKPGTRIPPHTGVTNTRAIIHLPLIVPPGCGFRVGGETREWVEGLAFAFDDTIEHEAWNDGDAPRAVLICDAWNPHLSDAERAAIIAYYAAADATGLNPAVA